MSKWKANLVTIASPSSDGTNYTGKANGSWGLNSQLQQKQAGLWAKGQTPTSAPVIGTAVKGNTQANVVFTAPTELGGSSIVSYIATSSPSSISATGTSSPITITGLTNGVSYTFTVAAINASGISSYSSPSNSIVPSIDITVPDTPTITSFTVNHTAKTVTLNFTPPADNGGSSITNYTLSINGASPVSIANTATSYTTTTISTFDVNLSLSAVNVVGPSVGAIINTNVFPNIGGAAGGGYYAGDIQQNGVVYGLIVSPKASGSVNAAYGIGAYGTSLNATSRIDGPVNTTSGATLGATAFAFCNNLVIGTYSDWYMPAIDEVEVMFRNLKPSTQTNNTSFGINSNAYPATTSNYTSTVPAQTSVVSFRYNNSECLVSSTNGEICSSTESAPQYMRTINMYTAAAGYNGDQSIMSKESGNSEIKVRAIRRVIKP
jgi:hypothetical protein